MHYDVSLSVYPLACLVPFTFAAKLDAGRNAKFTGNTEDRPVITSLLLTD